MYTKNTKFVKSCPLPYPSPSHPSPFYYIRQWIPHCPLPDPLRVWSPSSPPPTPKSPPLIATLFIIRVRNHRIKNNWIPAFEILLKSYFFSVCGKTISDAKGYSRVSSIWQTWLPYTIVLWCTGDFRGCPELFPHDAETRQPLGQLCVRSLFFFQTKSAGRVSSLLLFLRVWHRRGSSAFRIEWNKTTLTIVLLFFGSWWSFDCFVLKQRGNCEHSHIHSPLWIWPVSGGKKNYFIVFYLSKFFFFQCVNLRG